MNYVDLAVIKKYQLQLLNLAKTDEARIRDIWVQPDEEYLNDFSKIIHFYTAPHYQQLIFRFRHGDYKTCIFYKGCHQNDQKILLQSFGMSWSKAHCIIEFLNWVTNSLGTCDILQLDGKAEHEINDSQLFAQWVNQTNDIEFFFSLTEEQQNKFIEKYNSNYLDRFYSSITQ
jgi:hypothetical protein